MSKYIRTGKLVLTAVVVLFFAGIATYFACDSSLQSAEQSPPSVSFAPDKKSDENASEGEVFDPIKKNGEYFVGWPKPDLAFVFTGFQDGYIEPCGCAGMLEMKGGLSRRMSFLESLRQMEWPVVAIDGGDLCNSSTGKQNELKFNHTVDAFKLMKYDAVGLGKNDLRFPAADLLPITVNIPDVGNMFTCANVGLFHFDQSYLAPYKVIEKNGLRIGIVSIVTNGLIGEIAKNDLEIVDPVVKLKELLAELDKEKCNYLVLISHGKPGQVLKETQEILKSFPKKFPIVVVSDPPAEPPRAAPKFIDDRYYIEVGEKGKFAVVLGIYDDEKTPTRYQSVALDSRYTNAPLIVEMMKNYQDLLKELKIPALVKSFEHPKSEMLGNFVGSKKCESCHEVSYNVWNKSGHAGAWKTLLETAVPPRDHDPECIACHVVGWNATDKYPYTGGFNADEPMKTGHLSAVGCESCHGPGEKHIEAEMGRNKTLQAELQQAMRLPLESAQRNCVTCHDGDNSPHFNFETYWPKIEHKEYEDE